MGNGTPVSGSTGATVNLPMARGVNRIPPSAKARRRGLHLAIDVPLLLAVIMLLVFGLLMLYSASWDYSLMILEEKPTFMFERQLLWLGIGIVVVVWLAWMDYRRWQKLALPAMAVIIVALVAVLLSNIVVNNAARSLLGGSVRPSEAAKVVLVIYLAVWLYARREQLHDVSFGLFPLSAILGVISGLIILQPDLSAAAMVFILGGLLFFLDGGDTRQIVVFLVVAFVVGAIVFQLHPTGRQRLAEYRASVSDLTQAADHLARSLEAIVRGGWVGVGIGRAETKLTGLPVPPTDSIFAVVVEETGILGAAGLIFLYTVLLWRGLDIARRAPDGLGKLIASGLSIWITLEALINMAVLLGLVPFAGNALPFISYGGSSMLSNMAAVGILMSINRQSALKSEAEERTFDAVVDLRRRNGRRRLSRTRRVPKVER